MKQPYRWICLLLVFMLLFGGCQGQPEGVSSALVSVYPQNPPEYALTSFGRMLRNTYSADITLLPAGQAEEQTIQPTKEMLKGIDNIFNSGQFLPVQDQVPQVSGNRDKIHIHWFYVDYGSSITILGPCEDDRMYPDQMLAWISGDTYFVAPAEVFDQLWELITNPPEPLPVASLIDGETMDLALPVEENHHILQAVQMGDKLAVLCSLSQAESELHMVDSENGILLYTVPGLPNAQEMRISQEEEESVCIYTDTALYTFDLRNELLTEWPIPQSVASQMDPLAGPGFDKRGETLAYTAHEGVFLCDLQGQNAQMALDNEKLYQVIEDIPDGLAPRFVTPRLMNGGECLVADVVLPGIQVGYQGMAVLQLKTGEIQYYWDMKAPFTGWIHFPDDYTIVGGNSGLPHLDLRTGKISQNQYEWKHNEQITPDGRLAVWIDYEQDSQGVLTQYLRTQHNNEEPRQIAAAKGGRMQIIAVTNQSVICWYGTNEPDIDGTRRKGYWLFRLPQ